MSEPYCSSHSSWAFHWYKFKDIYCICLESLSALWNPQGEKFQSLGGNWFSRNKTKKLRLWSPVTQSVLNSTVARGSLRTPFVLRSNTIHKVLVFYENNLTAFVYFKRIELTKKKMLKDFAALWVYLMFGSNVNYYVMGRDVWKVCNGAHATS